MTLELGDIPTWLGAVATSVAVGIALAGLARERAARRADDAAAAFIARREQASVVSAWVSAERIDGINGTAIMIRNGSESPIYHAVLSLVLLQGAGARTGEELARDGLDPEWQRTVLVVPPGTWYLEVSGGWGGMHRQPGAEIAFMDVHGVAWVRRADGLLQELSEAPYQHFPVDQPRGHATIRPA